MTFESGLPEDLQSWLSFFEETHGRPLRILHIGNIANNAYINAKLLNEAGLDCDVICHNDYHIMTCPEWEDADFEGEIRDQFFPNWRSVNLNGYKRPRWFAQGPSRICIPYLISKRDGKKSREQLWWNILEVSRLIRCSWVGHYLANLSNGLLSRVDGLRNHPNLASRAIFTILWALKNRLRSLLDSLIPRASGSVQPSKKSLESSEAIQKNGCTNEYSFDEQVDILVRKWKDIFPDRQDKFSNSDVKHYRWVTPLWRNLFSQYDIVQGYATAPILPLLSGKPYLAFEHGTLREIPFQETSDGRNTALSYSLAEHVFVTNGDCLETAHKLAGDRVSFINHPFDEDHGLNVGDWEDLRRRLRDLLDADFLFFFPTRHDWVPGTGYGDKGNDVFLRAFCRLRQGGYRVGMACCRWGANVKESMNLLKEYDCDQYVLWSEPMGTVKFERTSRACDMIIDQFKLGSFGGITFKAMAVGAPICTYLDENKIGELYNEVPPVINCRTEEEVVTSITDILKNPTKLDNLQTASRKWIEKYHNSKETIEIQVSDYIHFMEKDNTYFHYAMS